MGHPKFCTSFNRMTTLLFVLGLGFITCCCDLGSTSDLGAAEWSRDCKGCYRPWRNGSDPGCYVASIFCLPLWFFSASPDMINQGDDGSCQYQVAQRQSKSIESRRKVGLLIALERRVTNHGMWRIMSHLFLKRFDTPRRQFSTKLVVQSDHRNSWSQLDEHAKNMH